MARLRVVFFGTPDFAVPTLAALLDAGHAVARVYTQPPRPAGRGQKPQESAVHAFALRRGLGIATPKSLKSREEHDAFSALMPDVAVVVAYGLLLPSPILCAPRLGCLNVHASLLPRWRGAAPIQRAILEGDAETGVTIMQMDEGLDTGPIILTEATPIGPADTAETIHDRLAAGGATLLIRALDGIEGGTLKATPQPAVGVTYAARLTREEGKLDWRRTAESLARQVRAFTPWPGAWFEHGGERLKVLKAECVAGGPGGARPGTVFDDALSVACGEGVLRILAVQRPGRSAMETAAMLRGHPIPAGTVLSLGA
ncbi:MAG: methionyl-tRNA formyltransferase [Alphaproteobacteria bacterium]